MRAQCHLAPSRYLHVADPSLFSADAHHFCHRDRLAISDHLGKHTPGDATIEQQNVRVPLGSGIGKHLKCTARASPRRGTLRTSFLHIPETDCMAGVVGFEL
jgi:hypothetical protein